MWHPVPGCQPLNPEIQVTSDHCQGRVKAPAKERKERCWSPSQVGTRRETSDRRGCTKSHRRASSGFSKRTRRWNLGIQDILRMAVSASGKFWKMQEQAFK